MLTVCYIVYPLLQDFVSDVDSKLHCVSSVVVLCLWCWQYATLCILCCSPLSHMVTVCYIVYPLLQDFVSDVDSKLHCVSSVVVLCLIWWLYATLCILCCSPLSLMLTVCYIVYPLLQDFVSDVDSKLHCVSSVVVLCLWCWQYATLCILCCSPLSLMLTVSYIVYPLL